MKWLRFCWIAALLCLMVCGGCQKEEAGKEERLSKVGQSCAKTADCEVGAVCLKQECCILNCSGKSCGSDGCGGSCGDCMEGTECVGGFCYAPYAPNVKIDACKAQLDNIANHLEMYLYEHDEYPSQLSELAERKKGKRKAILEESQLRDPWKKELKYGNNGDGFKLCSGGPDSKAGTDDDICFGEDDDE